MQNSQILIWGTAFVVLVLVTLMILLAIGIRPEQIPEPPAIPQEMTVEMSEPQS